MIAEQFFFLAQEMGAARLRVIRRMNRTLFGCPSQVPYFRDGDGRAVLGRLLLAFDGLFPAPGYVQGMCTLAAVVLLVLTHGGRSGALDEAPRESTGPAVAAAAAEGGSFAVTPVGVEEDAFWTFAAVVTGCLDGYFDEGMPELLRDTAAVADLVRRRIMTGAGPSTGFSRPGNCDSDP